MENIFKTVSSERKFIKFKTSLAHSLCNLRPDFHIIFNLNKNSCCFFVVSKTRIFRFFRRNGANTVNFFQCFREFFKTAARNFNKDTCSGSVSFPQFSGRTVGDEFSARNNNNPVANHFHFAENMCRNNDSPCFSDFFNQCAHFANLVRVKSGSRFVQN